MRSALDADLASLRARLLALGARASRMVHLAAAGLLAPEAPPLGLVRAEEEEADRLRVEVDELCVRLLALRQPEAVDLREVAAALRMNADLERAADQALEVAELGLSASRGPAWELGALPRMAEIASGMLADALRAYERRDADLARAVLSRDDEEDALNEDALRAFTRQMAPDSVPRLVSLVLAARGFERIADHATNVAEEVLFLVGGRDVRHGRAVLQSSG